MDAMRRRRPRTRFEIFTTVPPAFFCRSLPPGSFRYHRALVDFGLVQRTRLREDLAATVHRLKRAYPIPPRRLDRWAARLERLRCELVLCDIAPLGLRAAARAGLRSVLVENFTWDWILARHRDRTPAHEPFLDYLAESFGAASLRIRAAPACGPARGHARVAPISRLPRRSRARVRRALSVPPHAPLVLVTLGHGTLPRSRPDCRFVGPATQLYHPDLVRAADAIVGKIGYSTLAEAYAAGTPFGYVPRDSFPESPVLERFVHRERLGLRIEPDAFARGDWADALEALLARRPSRSRRPNGAREAARLILQRRSATIPKIGAVAARDPTSR
jgi:hypothetical protein